MEVTEEVKSAVSDLQQAVHGKLDKVGAELKERGKQFDELELKVQRMNLGGVVEWSDGRSRETWNQREALELGIRALFAGSQSRADAHFAELKGMQAGADPDGGYFVTPTFSTELTKIMAEISPLSRLARTIPLDHGLSFEEVVDKEQAEATWVGELTPARTDTATPGVGKILIPVHEIYAMPKASQTLIDAVSFDIVGWLQEKVAEAFATSESTAFHSGDGVARPRGFLTYSTSATPDSTRTWGTIEHINTGANGAFPTASTSVNSADPLIEVTSALKPQYRSGAVWLMNRATSGVVRKLKDADGRHVWVDSLIQGQPNTLLGFPVEISEDMPAHTSTGALAIAFGNFKKAYTIVRRLGIRFLIDPFTDKPNVRLYTFQRVGGGVNNFEAVKFLRFSS